MRLSVSSRFAARGLTPSVLRSSLSAEAPRCNSTSRKAPLTGSTRGSTGRSASNALKADCRSPRKRPPCATRSRGCLPPGNRSFVDLYAVRDLRPIKSIWGNEYLVVMALRKRLVRAECVTHRAAFFKAVGQVLRRYNISLVQDCRFYGVLNGPRDLRLAEPLRVS